MAKSWPKCVKINESAKKMAKSWPKSWKINESAKKMAKSWPKCGNNDGMRVATRWAEIVTEGEGEAETET